MFPDKTKVQLEGNANVRKVGKQRDTDRDGQLQLKLCKSVCIYRLNTFEIDNFAKRSSFL